MVWAILVSDVCIPRLSPTESILSKVYSQISLYGWLEETVDFLTYYKVKSACNFFLFFLLNYVTFFGKTSSVPAAATAAPDAAAAAPAAAAATAAAAAAGRTKTAL